MISCQNVGNVSGALMKAFWIRFFLRLFDAVILLENRSLRFPANDSHVGRDGVLSSMMCKWTRPFWGMGSQRSPKSLSLGQAASLCSVGIERARKCLQGCYHSTHSLLSGVVGDCQRAVSSSLRPRPSAFVCSVLISDHQSPAPVCEH